jgi:trk system potassium uptake protein TrkH
MRLALQTRPVFYIVGLLVTTVGAAMLLPAAIDAINGSPDWQVFLSAAGVTVFAGIALFLSNRVEAVTLSVHQAFLVTTTSWLAVAFFGALPFTFSALGLDLSDAFFEAMSGLTTTGSTVISGLDSAPPGILLWRGLLQWLGGIGIIVTAVALLPFLKVGGMQLFKTESSDTSDKTMPRVARIALGILLAYVFLTIVCVTALRLAGMTMFEAVVHSMTAISTGGFSTSDGSIGHFHNAAIDWITIVFMIAGSVPFVLYIRMAMGQRAALLTDSQVRSFVAFVAAVSLVLAGWIWWNDGYAPADALRLAAFNVTSVVTTTGFVTDDYSLWGAFPVGAFLLLTFVGGCTGSTAGGIKVFRFEVLALMVRRYLWQLVYPHGVREPIYANRPVSPEILSAVSLFVVAFLFLVGIVTLGLTAFGLDPVTSLSAAATAAANVGPGLGPIVGPSGNFSALPDGAKWILSLAMLLGRLEIFSVGVLVTPAFWRG